MTDAPVPGFTQITYHVAERICRITLSRPESRNAQSRILLEELDAAFTLASSDDDVGVIVLFGAGEHFCAGHDLGTADEMADREHRPIAAGVRGRYEHSRSLYVDLTTRWRDLPKPTIAAVHGYCIFAGWMIASAMDLIFATKDAMFLGSNFQWFSMPWDIHPRKAKELLYQSRFIDGAEAEALGLVNHAVEASTLEATVMAYARDVAQNDPFQLRMMKLAVNQMQDNQGFGAHMSAAHTMHMLSALGEADADFALKPKPGSKRRPMVQRALENYQKHQEQAD